ncbi:hypothetical protein FCIRC_8797 [Fusarium circinatum]|uniref:Uncharacterized protein n=1 Tax=Fusarium circinatum TaxID=48490 RepID=A0A8H5TJN7_FUSCI|nr:hypothetical protein FCIRC_8797 [Fusarium circinatum]
MNKYHYDALLRRINSSPSHFDALKSITRVPYHNLLITTGLSREYHPLPRTLYKPQDVLEGYWTVTVTLQSTAWLQITIRPALRDDPPSHAWHDLDNYHQIQAGVTLRIGRRNALRDMHYLLELVFPLYFMDSAVLPHRRRYGCTVELDLTSDRVLFQILRKTGRGNRDIRRTEKLQYTRRSDGLQDIL